MRKNSIKNTRINMEVQRELSQIIRSEIKDPRIHPLTSVVAVEVTPDLKYCKAYISVLGDEEAGKATIEGLRSAASFVRRELAHRVNLRNTLIYALQYFKSGVTSTATTLVSGWILGSLISERMI
jgi:ribosome-binding factor A